MFISLVNFTKLRDADVQRVVRAINRQIAEDFRPYWHWGAQLRLEGKVAAKPSVKKGNPEELRGDAILYLWDQVDIDDALGYHDKNFLGLPYGFVFTELSKQLGEDWSVTLSHEALELVGDASSNTFAAGPHPKVANHTVFHWYEMCDAVQAETYAIDGINVSNFVLPLYFTESNERGARNDFLGTVTKNGTLQSFGVNPGGYIGFFDPAKKDSDTFELAGDKKAQKRREIKQRAGMGRRANRYRQAVSVRPSGLVEPRSLVEPVPQRAKGQRDVSSRFMRD